MTPGPIALVGSGEYLPQMAEVEGGLLAGRPPRYVQLATAAAPEGPRVTERWHRLGREQAARLGVEAVALPVLDRAGADDAAIAAQVAGAGLVYLSGGNPSYLAETLRGSVVWAAIVEAWRGGAALAGCSAGAMAMGSWVPSLRHPKEGGTEGLGSLQQGYVEQSNVSVVDEFINLITSQRAYEANSKVVKAADDMYQQANNLRK